MTYRADLEAIYARLQQGDLASAADDIASLAAELEEARTRIAELDAETRALQAASEHYEVAFRDLTRILGHDHGDVDAVLGWVLALRTKAQNHEKSHGR